jgi:invasion protein IalB
MNLLPRAFSKAGRQAGPFLASLLLAAVVSAPPAAAQQRQAARGSGGGTAYEIGKAGAWGIFTSGEGRSKNCFVMAQPAERLPKGLTRDPAYVFVTMRMNEASKMEFSMLTGYPLKQGSDAQLTVGSVNFAGVGQNKTVWLKNPAEENRFIGEMRKGGTLQVKGTSQRGNDTTDRYPLTGFSQALERAQKECS